MMSNSFASIYVLKHPETGKVRYVGKTARTLEKRLGEHLRSSKSYSHRCANWIKSLQKQGLTPSIELLEKVNLSELEEKEIAWIKKFREEGLDLTNLTDGGEGTIGLKRSAESRKKMSMAHKGKKLSEEHKRSISKALKGRKKHPGHGTKVSAGLKAKGIGPTKACIEASSKANRGEGHRDAKLTEAQVLEIYALLRSGIPNQEIADKYGVKRPTISNIRSGRKWKHLYDHANPIPKGSRWS